MTGKRKSGSTKKLLNGRAPDAPMNLPGVPSMPRGLPTRAQTEWRRVIGLLERRGDLSELDQCALADYCICCVRVEELEADISRRGLLIRGQRGMVKNPSIQLAREYRRSLVRWTDALGLNPASRNRMTLPEKDPGGEDDILD